MKFSIELEIEVTKTVLDRWRVQWLESDCYGSESLDSAVVLCAKDIKREITSEWLAIKLKEGIAIAKSGEK